ncbi:hypothetical protein FDH29_gp07 [Aquamicrobium phage P14]|uniref:Uncharacterized protein n=1 Tax=Aquamicrobium phage P14 TaxID=1927013 RepID=A0A1L5C046_9CAUD|nr:hypothetical protein FDH29_gp07 [Aquamicrobium phage P14]APL99465.1 hypothetical protein BB738_0070 [Aquamicrobium phage P14]
MLRSIAGAKKGEVYTAYPLEDGTVLVRNDRWDLYLYGPNACEQFREGVTWEVVT